ncbi:MAG: sodium/solute symporter [Bacteroidota bacterium]
MFDLLIVLSYFSIVLFVALSGRKKGEEVSTEEFFLSSRSLRWPSIALSTIATNIQGYQFLGMMGSAYLYGLAQANFEINAVQGMWLAAFVFVPLYLKERIITITQFIQKRMGEWVALTYSVANMLLFATIGLGAALFWGAYAADLVFGEIFATYIPEAQTRITLLIIFLGVFSAIYTFFGGLTAVVRTDIIQFSLLTLGGIILLFISVKELGGIGELYEQTGDKMHLHLSNDHPKLPWIGMIGLLFLNINYWCANQSVIQRSLAARSLKDVQIGLMVGGLLKYMMAAIIIIPGIALVGVLGENGLTDPDAAFPYLINHFLPTGLRGIIVCALFASLMSTVDSTFNSLGTLFSIDIYQKYLNPPATDRQMVNAGKMTILVTLFSGILTAYLLMTAKLDNAEVAFTHTLNELRTYINGGIVVIICLAVLLTKPDQWRVLIAALLTIGFHAIFLHYTPEMSYLERALWVILLALAVGLVSHIGKSRLSPVHHIYQAATRRTQWFGWIMLASLVGLHVIFS